MEKDKSQTAKSGPYPLRAKTLTMIDSLFPGTLKKVGDFYEWTLADGTILEFIEVPNVETD